MSNPHFQSPVKRRGREQLLRVACVLAILALGLIVWSVLVPTPLPVLVALSVGQALGTASFVTFLIIVASDLRLRRTLESAPSSERKSERKKE